MRCNPCCCQRAYNTSSGLLAFALLRRGLHLFDQLVSQTDSPPTAQGNHSARNPSASDTATSSPRRGVGQLWSTRLGISRHISALPRPLLHRKRHAVSHAGLRACRSAGARRSTQGDASARSLVAGGSQAAVAKHSVRPHHQPRPSPSPYRLGGTPHSSSLTNHDPHPCLPVYRFTREAVGGRQAPLAALI